MTQEAAFTRTGERNRVTGVETFGAWTPATKELAQEATPVVTGFVADKANVAAKTVTPNDKDSEEVVQYKKLGSYVPNVPDGLPKVPNLPYPMIQQIQQNQVLIFQWYQMYQELHQ